MATQDCNQLQTQDLCVSPIIGSTPTVTQQVIDRVCVAISIGQSLRRILATDPTLPPATTILTAIGKNPAWMAQYAHARSRGHDAMAEEIIDIADQPRIGDRTEVRQDKDGNVLDRRVTTADMVDRAKLQCDTRRWLLSKMAPKRYGDRLELAGDGDNPITLAVAYARPQAPRIAPGADPDDAE